jgi:hypothetical protein
VIADGARPSDGPHREAPMSKAERQLTLLVGQMGGHLNLLGEQS